MSYKAYREYIAQGSRRTHPMALYAGQFLCERAIERIQSCESPGCCGAVGSASILYKRDHMPLDADGMSAEEFCIAMDGRARVDNTARLIHTILQGFIPQEGQPHYREFQRTGYYWPNGSKGRRERVQALRAAQRIIDVIERAEHRLM